MYTFLNAMTYPDRTVYPVASCNHQDFANLMDVYLDAVFNPLLSENTFLQEGWHYDINPETSELSYSGVVYNEMLGSYSDPENVLMDELHKILFPDSVYGHSSGGDPDYIPNLSYAEFVAFHEKYYHPSNSQIFLFGDFDILDRLSHLDNYLKTFDYQKIDSAIHPQPRFSSGRFQTAAYPITAGETHARNCYAVHSYMLDHPTDPHYYMTLSILSRILSGTPASPLRKALIDSHLGESTINYGFEH